jgi:tetratricopeptide (TPR) repeat protein
VAPHPIAQFSQNATVSATKVIADALTALAMEAVGYQVAGRHAEAIGLYDLILSTQPGLSQIHNNRGLALAALGRFDAAVASYQRAIALRPQDPQVLCSWAAALAEDGRTEEAEQTARQAVALNPRLAQAHNNLALILKEKGRLNEAEAAAKQAIQLAPHNPAYYEHLGMVRPFVPGDHYLAALEGLAKDLGALRVTDRIHLHFALGKAYEDTGRFEDAFPHWLEANARKRHQLGYDEGHMLALMERTRATFTREFIASGGHSGVTSALPVFIVGMPRSGSTLIEQILASHPAVFGGGELNLFDHAAGAIGKGLPGEPSFPDMIAAMSAEHFAALGSLYLEELKKRAPQAARITDKMPANFLFAGLIHLALPNATIIHAVRDPADTGVSCFATNFTRGQPFTYDLAEIGRYYSRYRALMAHWHEVLPRGRILDVRYEELVADMPTAARRIVAHCGLAWDARCLDFHKSERAVRTASAAQVRKPIYRSSVGRWRNYQSFLGPLLAELETGQ